MKRILFVILVLCCLAPIAQADGCYVRQRFVSSYSTATLVTPFVSTIAVAPVVVAPVVVQPIAVQTIVAQPLVVQQAVAVPYVQSFAVQSYGYGGVQALGFRQRSFIGQRSFLRQRSFFGGRGVQRQTIRSRTVIR